MPILTTDRRRRMRVGIGLVSIAIVLAGCASSPSDAASTSASSTASPATHSAAPASATPSPPASATASPSQPADADPADWQITFDGVGPLSLAGSLSAGVTAAGPAYNALGPSSCPNPAMTILKSSSNPTIWVEASADASDEIGMVAVGGDAAGDPREAGSPKTREGIAVGSTLEELKAAYPKGRLEEGGNLPNPRLVVSGKSSSGLESYLVFHLNDGVVETILVQRNPDRLYYEFCG